MRLFLCIARFLLHFSDFCFPQRFPVGVFRSISGYLRRAFLSENRVLKGMGFVSFHFLSFFEAAYAYRLMSFFLLCLAALILPFSQIHSVDSWTIDSHCLFPLQILICDVLLRLTSSLPSTERRNALFLYFRGITFESRCTFARKILWSLPILKSGTTATSRRIHLLFVRTKSISFIVSALGDIHVHAGEGFFLNELFPI